MRLQESELNQPISQSINLPAGSLPAVGRAGQSINHLHSYKMIGKYLLISS
jgi:hypothetical protein